MRSWTPWLVLYGLLLTGLFVGLWQAREHVLRTLDTPEALEHWQEWKKVTERDATQPTAIKRKAVRANEPALLIMLRDRFALVFVGAAVLSSLLYFFSVVVIRGMMGERMKDER